MGGLLFTALLVAAVLAWLWKRRTPAAPRALGGIDFRAGRAVEVRGPFPRTSLMAFEEIAAMTELTGEIRLAPDGQLEFSDDVPPGVRQQLRNAWTTSRHVH